jgi:hypothetical protein
VDGRVRVVAVPAGTGREPVAVRVDERVGDRQDLAARRLIGRVDLGVVGAGAAVDRLRVAVDGARRVVAGAREEDVDAAASGQRVGAVAAVEDVRAVVARERVGAGDRVGPGAGADVQRRRRAEGERTPPASRLRRGAARRSR